MRATLRRPLMSRACFLYLFEFKIMLSSYFTVHRSRIIAGTLYAWKAKILCYIGPLFGLVIWSDCEVDTWVAPSDSGPIYRSCHGVPLLGEVRLTLFCRTIFLVKILKDVCFRTHEIASKIYKKKIANGWGSAADPAAIAHDDPRPPSRRSSLYVRMDQCRLE